MEALEDKRRQRLLFMKTVYDKTQGDRFTFTNLAEIAPVIGLSQEDAGRVGEYLVGEGLIEWAYFGGGIAITHRGIKEVELALSQPDRPTEHFSPAINVIHIGQMTSQIQQGTVGSVQNQQVQSVGEADITELARFVEEVKRARGDLPGGADAGADLDAQLATIEAQMRSPKPHRAVLKAAGGVLLEILKSASGSTAAELVKRIPSLLR
jgi:hypothetical protein